MALAGNENDHQPNNVSRISASSVAAEPQKSEEQSTNAFPWLGATYMAAFYGAHPEFRKSINDAAVRNVILPAVMKYEMTKDEGLKFADYITMGCALIAGYAAKKTTDALNLWDALRTGNFTKTKEALSSFSHFLNKHKGKLTAATVAAGAAMWLWSIKRVADSSTQLPLLDRFYLSLSSEQRLQILESEKLSTVLAEAAANPTQLITDEAFVALLSDEQKALLTSAVEEHTLKNDPLSLLAALD